jgi:iron complex transport system substrate-binding protein
MRIVSLACSNTEIVHALECGHWLVGVDDHSDHPAALLEGLPRVGPDLEIDVAAVAALEPDLVLASLTVPGHETVVEGMEEAGLPVLTLAPEGLPDVPDSVVTVARALGVEARGLELARQMREAFGIGEPADGSEEGDRPRILVQWWPRPVIAPGARSWIQDLVHRAGGENALSHEDRLSRPLTDEEVAALAPDAVVVSWCGVSPAKYRPEVVYRNPAFAELPAIRNGQVHCIPEGLLGRPGPRLMEGLKALRGVVASVREGAPVR